MVAYAFLPNPDNKPEVNHLNGNGYDNRVENLEWSTRSENAKHAYDNGFIAKSKCTRCGKLIMTGKIADLENYVCGKCSRKDEVLDNREKKIKAIHEELSDWLPNNELDEIIKDMRMRGLTLQQIGDEVGFTREYIRQRIATRDKKKKTNQPIQ